MTINSNGSMALEKMPEYQKLQMLRMELKSKAVKLDDSIDVVIRALLSKTHCLLLGVPGVGKSMVASLIASAIETQSFDKQLSDFTQPAELWGKPDVRALVEDGKDQRIGTGMLQESKIVILDELFKGSKATLSDLLNFMSDAIFRDGGKSIKCPVWSVIATSNETPQEEGMEAHYDRIVQRFHTLKPTEVADKVAIMKIDGKISIQTKISEQEFINLQEKVKQVSIADDIYMAIIAIETKVNAEGFFPSPRRMRQIKSVIKAQALMNGRSHVNMEDLLVFGHCIWDEMDDAKRALEIVKNSIYPKAKKAQEAYDQCFNAIDTLLERCKAKGIPEADTSVVERIKSLIDESAQALKKMGPHQNILNPMLTKMRKPYKECIDTLRDRSSGSGSW